MFDLAATHTVCKQVFERAVVDVLSEALITQVLLILKSPSPALNVEPEPSQVVEKTQLGG